MKISQKSHSFEAVKALIIINIASHATFGLLEIFLKLFGESSDTILHIKNTFSIENKPFAEQPWTIFTYFLIQDSGFFTLMCRIVQLYIFGNIIVRHLNKKHLFIIYIVAPILAGIGSVILNIHLPYFKKIPMETIAGSGASIYAIVIAACILKRESRHNFILFRVELKYIALLFIMLSLGEIAQEKLLGNSLNQLLGALFGALYIWILKIKKTTTPNPNPPKEGTDLDSILEKISRVGYQNLTPEEKTRLFEKSQ